MANSASLNFDLLARDRASDKFAKVGKAADSTGSKLSKLGKVAKVGMLGLAGATIGAAGALGLMVKSAVEDEKSQKRLATTLKNTTKATDDQIASVEDWITAQGKAYGVADDDLRPALEKLSVATGDISKAQHLASLAMDVSAGTGKSLESVSLALSKAYNGNVGGLGRLGIATKDAEGKTKTFAQIQDDLAKKFKGQAKTAAETFSGRLKRFKLAVSEAGESIGYALLPLLTRLAGVVVNKAIPALEKGAGKVADFLKAVRKSKAVQATFDTIKTAASGIGDGFAKAKRALDNIKSTVGSINLDNLDGSKIGKALGDAVVSGLQRLGTLAGKIGETLSNLFSKVDWVGLGIAIGKQAPSLLLGLVAGIVNFDMGSMFRGIAAHWSDILIGSLIIAFAPAKFIGPIGRILSKIPFVGKFLARALIWVNELGGKLKSFGADLLRTFWRGFTSTPIPGAGFVTRVIRAIAGLPGALAGFWRSIQTRMGVWALDAFEAAGRGARSGINKLVALARTIGGKILGAVGNLGSLLYGAGKAAIQGLINGVLSMVGPMISALKKITSLIPKNKGPIEKDRILLHPAGQAIMQGLIDGMKKKWTPVKDFLQKVTDKVAATGEKLKGLIDTRNQFASGFQSFSSSIFGRDPGQDADGNAIPESVAGIKAFALRQRKDADRLASNVKRLVGLGLSKDLLAQLQSSGASGLAQINTLASSASKSDIAFLNAQNKATASADLRAGMSAANAIYGSDIAKAKRDADTAKAIAAELSKALKPYLDREMVGKISGDDIIISIRRTQKKKGQKVTI